MTYLTDNQIDYNDKSCQTIFGGKKLPEDIAESNTLVGFSTSQKYHNAYGLSSEIDYLQSLGFKKLKYFPAHILERYNLAIDRGCSAEEMLVESKKLYQTWCSNNEKALQKIPQGDIYDLEEIKNNPEYSFAEYQKVIQSEYDKKGELYNDLRKDAERYLMRRKKNSVNPDNYNFTESNGNDSEPQLTAAGKLAVEYKIEEISYFMCLAKKESFHYFAYPGSMSPAVKSLYLLLNPQLEEDKKRKINKRKTDKISVVLKPILDSRELLFKWFALNIDLPKQEKSIQNIDNVDKLCTEDASEKIVIDRKKLFELTMKIINNKLLCGIKVNNDDIELLNLCCKITESSENKINQRPLSSSYIDLNLFSEKKPVTTQFTPIITNNKKSTSKNLVN